MCMCMCRTALHYKTHARTGSQRNNNRLQNHTGSGLVMLARAFPAAGDASAHMHVQCNGRNPTLQPALQPLIKEAQTRLHPVCCSVNRWDRRHRSPRPTLQHDLNPSKLSSYSHPGPLLTASGGFHACCTGTSMFLAVNTAAQHLNQKINQSINPHPRAVDPGGCHSKHLLKSHSKQHLPNLYRLLPTCTAHTHNCKCSASTHAGCLSPHCPRFVCLHILLGKPVPWGPSPTSAPKKATLRRCARRLPAPSVNGRATDCVASTTCRTIPTASPTQSLAAFTACARSISVGCIRTGRQKPRTATTLSLSPQRQPHLCMGTGQGVAGPLIDKVWVKQPQGVLSVCTGGVPPKLLTPRQSPFQHQGHLRQGISTPKPPSDDHSMYRHIDRYHHR